MKAGDTKILITTDVLARGMDIPCITHVVNFEHPGETDDYVHRIGRTARGEHGIIQLLSIFFENFNIMH